MNTKVKRFALLLAVLALTGMLTLGAFAAEEKRSGDFTYVVQNDNTVKITAYDGGNKDAVIPSEIDGKSVTALGRYAFHTEAEVVSITIPGSVEIFEQDAIYFCEKLETVTIEEGKLKRIPGTGILNCSAFRTLNLPSNVESIGVLMGCQSLENINIAPGNTFLKSVDGVVYSADGKTLVKFPQGKKAEKFDIPAEVTTIEDNAFYEVKGIGKICIPLTVETIGEMAFAYNNAVIDYAGTTVPEKFKPAFAGRTVYTKLVAPAAVEKPSFTATTTTVTISWKAVSGAHGYELHKYNSSTKKYEPYKTTEKTSIKLTGLKSATSYKYKVRAYVKGEETLYGAFSPEVKTTTKPAKVTKLTATATKASVTLKWSKVTGADGYRVQKYNSGAKKYETVKTVTANSVKLTGLKSGTTYKFRVRAYKKDGDTIYGAYSSVKEITTKLSAPSKITSKGGSTSVKLTWSKSRGADGYRIYYKSGDSWKTLVKSVKGTTYTLKDLPKAKKRTYAVRAYKKTNDGTMWSDYKQFSAATKPGKTTLTVKSGSPGAATLTWKEVKGANTYRVYYKVNKGDYKLYKTYSKPTKVTLKKLKGGDTYTFKVQAGIKVTGGTVWGDAVTKSVKITYRAPRYLKAMKSGNYLITTVFGGVETTTAIKGNNLYVKTDDYYSDEADMTLIYIGAEEKWYYIYDAYGVYTVVYDYQLPEKETGTAAIESVKSMEIPTKYKSAKDRIDGKTVFRETANYDGYSESYYFDGTTLVRIDLDYGSIIVNQSVTEFTTSVPDKLFKLPAGYQYVEAEI
ncbi:MAG: hypothetical protein E7538_04105 [Ruminococcaceae bacterium]|nr:hypothetical protein [Oscillospiraceae bacterium]